MRACRAYKGVYKVYRNPRRTTLRNQYEIRRNPWENHRNIRKPYERNSFRKHIVVDTNKTNHGGKGCQLRKEISLNLASETASEGFRKTCLHFWSFPPGFGTYGFAWLSYAFIRFSYGSTWFAYGATWISHDSVWLLYGFVSHSFPKVTCGVPMLS